MEELIKDIMKRRGALHIINDNRYYTEDSVRAALIEALTTANKNFILSGVSGSEIRLTANAIELHHGRIKATMLVDAETDVIHIMANDKSDVELVDLSKTSCNGGEFHLR